jgi:hypothetical protein
MKLQAPSSKLQRNPKSQTPSTKSMDDGRILLRFGAWLLSGAWSLGFGILFLIPADFDLSPQS